MAIKQTSANITPKSNATAARKPLVMLVSNNTQKTGPIINAVKNPIVMGVKTLKSTSPRINNLLCRQQIFFQ